MNTTARDVALLILGVVIGVAIRGGLADGLQLELGAGVAKGKTAPEGIWWESAYPTANRVQSPSVSLGISRTFGRIGLRADYADLLRFSTDNVAIPNEHAVSAKLAGAVACSAANRQFCLARWRGNGSASGVHAGIFYNVGLGHFQVQPEVGLLAYRYQFAMRISPVEAEALSGMVSTDSGAGSGNALTHYLRLTVQRGAWWLRLTYDHSVKGPGGVVGIQEGPVVTMLVGVSVPL